MGSNEGRSPIVDRIEDEIKKLEKEILAKEARRQRLEQALRKMRGLPANEDDEIYGDVRHFLLLSGGTAEVSDIVEYLAPRHPEISKKALYNRVYRLAIRDHKLRNPEKGVYSLPMNH